jgi:DNA primase
VAGQSSQPLSFSSSARGAGRGDDRERVRDASDIVRIVGEHVQLKAKGREYAGLCPFHDDHRPSMSVIPQKQIFHCFVCGTGGDVFSFVQKYHKMEFREALEYLAEKANIALTPFRGGGEDGAEAGADGRITRNDLLRANTLACQYFRTILQHPEHGAAARAVIERRGIAPGMVEAFALGAGAARWDGLVLTAQGKGLDLRALVEAGLIKRREQGNGSFYDALRNRLIFPIHDQIGRVIAFGGRKIDEADEPKYLNSPETRLFDKSSTLYGLHQAARPIQAERVAIVTEGYTDVIACHQAGVTNAVATLGTALTQGHALVLKRLCDTVVLLFDGDEAGQRAADRAVPVFFAEPIDVKIATLSRVTDAKDPDELLKREGGLELFRKALDQATDLLSFRFARLKDRLRGAGLSALNRAIEDELGQLVDMGLANVAPLRKRKIIQHLSRVAGVDEATILAAVPSGRRGRTGPVPGARVLESAESPTGSAEGARAELLGCILCDPNLRLSMTAQERDLIHPGAYSSALLKAIAQAVADTAADGQTPDHRAVLGALGVEGGDQGDGQGSQDTAVALMRHVEQITDQDQQRLNEHWRSCLRLVASAASKAAAAAPAATDQEPTLDEMRERLTLQRQHHAAFGGDHRVLPRPA